MMMMMISFFKRTYRTSPNTIQWNKMIKTHQLNGNYQQALKLFQIGIEKQTFEPNSQTYLTILDICKELKSLSTLYKIDQLINLSKNSHDDISNNPHIKSLLMNVYIKCNDIENAYRIFENIREKNLIDYCSIITALNNEKQYKKTFEIYKKIPLIIKYSSPILSTLILQTCIELKYYNDGLIIHKNSQKFLPNDKILMNQLLNFYLAFYQEEKALEIFEKYHSQQTIIDYSLLMKFYNRTYQLDKTINLYNRLKNNSNIKIDHIIYVLVLQAIANGCCLYTSQQILEHIQKFEKNIDIDNALINMYGKLGDLNQAEKVFSSMSKHNIVTYNILLNLYGIYRQSDKALKTYNQMCQQGYRPDDKTYVLILHALSQTPNKINDVKRIFSNIEEIKRGPMLTSAMIAALIHAELYDEVNNLLKKLPNENILYYAIKANINKKIDKFNYPIIITNEQLALYDLLMSNMYTYAGLHDQLTVIDDLLYNNKYLKNILSYSWYEKSNGKIEYFKSNNTLLLNCEHTEKFAIINALKEEKKDFSLPILIGKNHRICNECHEYFKKLSLSEKKIFLRDSTCFHLFSNGQCSCEVCS